MAISIRSKLPDVGTTIFTVMSQLANEAGAINLAQGFPSFEPPAELLDRIGFYLHNGANQYAPMAGVESLRHAILDKTQRLQSQQFNADSEITMSAGATEALFSAIQAVVHPGDEVVLIDPAYDSYEPAVRLAGGISRRVALAFDAATSCFSIDWQRLADAIGARTQLLVVNFPHNPTGLTLSRNDLDKFADLVRNTNCLILSDEVYEHIVMDGKTHNSVLSHPELWPRSMIVSSFGKTLHATGWKIGYCIAPQELSAEFRKVHQFNTFTVNTPIQHAIADFLNQQPAFGDTLAQFYANKRDLFCDELRESRFRFRPTKSTFFQILDYSELDDGSDLDVARRWTREHGVAAIPLSPFYATPTEDRLLRFCFAKDDQTLRDAAAILRAI